jgi:Tol biopolymer transport system component
MRRFAAALLALSAGLLLNSVSAAATFPGQNGKIAFARYVSEGGGDLFTIDESGENASPLTAAALCADPFCREPSVSSDGERVAFTRGGLANSDIFVIGVDGQDPAPVTQTPAFESSPSFFPDGRIAFQRFDGNDTEIAVIGPDGQNEVTLTNNTVDDGDPRVSPDGETIAFTSEDGMDTEVFVMDSNGQNRTPLTANDVPDGSPSFSPDGEAIAFTRNSSGGPEIFVMNADGQNQTPLGTATVQDFTPSFSPDGQRIVYSGIDGSGQEIYVMDANGQNQAPVTDVAAPGVGALDPSWQPLNPPACDLTGPPKQTSFKLVSVTVTCANENASLTASGQGTAKVPKLATASKAKRFTIPPVTASVPAGTPTTVELPIPKKGKKALKRAAKAGKKGKATVTTTATDDFGETTQDSLAVKFKKKKQQK